MILFLFSILFFFFSFFFFLVIQVPSSKNQYLLEERKKNPIFAILIPARDESLVIEDLLKSIQNQTRKVSMNHVFVIVETRNDPTVLLCQKYQVQVIVRKHLEKRSKGYALEEAIEFLKKQQLFFDAYFIFDADNILDSRFIEEMEKDYQKGYTISTGYRNLKNADDSLVACASGLTYLFLNEWMNRQNQNKKKNVLISGTGFYLHGRLIKEWGTYPFHSLTEDMELNYYGILHQFSTHYNDKAIFYDEQPITIQQSVKQRKRWIRGFFVNWFRMIPKFWKKKKEHPVNIGSIYSSLYGIVFAICLVFGIILFLLSFLCFFIQTFSFWFLFLFLFFFFGIYLFLVLVTDRMLKKQKECLNISKRMKRKVIWYHPLFLISYIYVFFLTILSKEISWERIEHGTKNS